MTALERFMRYVDKNGKNGCWIWTGYVETATGYGKFHYQGRPVLVHRWAHETWKGPIPEGHHIDHLCSIRLCVNPDHLDAVTQAVNNRRAWSLHRPKTCPQGHVFDEANTFWDRHGWRKCRQCGRDRALAYYYKNKASA